MCDLSAPLSLAPVSPLRCAALAHARFAALWRRSRSRPARRFGAAAVYGGGKDFLCDLSAPLSLTLGSPRCGGALAHARLAALWRRSRAARFAALGGAPAPLGSLLCGGALAHARFAALWRRSRSRPARRFVAALSLTLGSPLSVSVRRFPAAAKTLCATFGRRSRSRPARRPFCPCSKPCSKKCPRSFFEHGQSP